MNVLIVGGAGFVGTNLAHACVRDAHRVTVFDSLDPQLRSSTEGLASIRHNISFVHGDVRNTPLIAESVLGQDVIFNCAGQTSHPLSMKQPMFDAELNVLGNLALLEAVRIHNPQATVVYMSSSTVVGKAVTSPIDESHAEHPLDIYSANKLAAEKYYRIYRTAHELKTVVLRFPNLYGPHGKAFPEFGFINYFISLAARDEPIRIFGEGQQTRNAIYVGDACDVLLRAATASKLLDTPMFVAHHEHPSVSQIATQIVAVLGRGSVIHVDWPEDRRRIEVDDVKISGSHLHAVLGWRPTYSLESGLEETLATQAKRQ